MIKGELPIYNPSFKAPSHLPDSFIEVFLCCCNPDQRFGCEVLPTPDLARKEGITPGIKNLREVGLPTSLGGGGEPWSLFLMIGTEPNGSRGALSLFLQRRR